MKLNGKCVSCGGDIRFDATPMPLANTEGQEGFFEYDFDCPCCGYNMEGVVKAREGKEAKRE